MLRKLLLTFGALLLVIVVGGGIYVASRQNLKFDPPYPHVVASTDSAIVERGRYIVRTVAPRASCHGDPKQRAAYDKGEDTPLVGAYDFAIPPGKFYTRNLTADKETGLGNVSDSAIARALRQGVGHDGRALLPFMELQELSDDDLQAVVSYLRTQPAVSNQVSPHDFNLLGKVVKATALSHPVGPASTPFVKSPRGASVEAGRYLVEDVALCSSCRTERNQMTGAFTGPRFGGTKNFLEESDPTHSWAPPNITSDKETGRLVIITEDQFVARFHQGRVLPGSPMPWTAYSHLQEDDLRAIYMYLKSVPSVRRDNGPVMLTVQKS
ncbi:MAG: cytochrome C [Gemmatimonadaceae bacterium]